MARQTRKISIEEKDKYIIAQYKRLKELWKAERSRPWVKLDVPIRKGWKKFFVLREDIARRSDAHELARILGVINHTITCENKEFKTTHWKTGKKEDIPHVPEHIPANSWDKYEWPEYFKTKWFDFKTKIKPGLYGSSYEIKGWWFKYPWMFSPKIRPNILTHVRERNPDEEKEEKAISRWFERTNSWPRLDHLLLGQHKGSYYGDPNKTSSLEIVEKREFRKAAKEYYSREENVQRIIEQDD
jgi:hypothetical protein